MNTNRIWQILLVAGSVMVTGCVQSHKDGLKPESFSIDYADYLPTKSTGSPEHTIITVKDNSVIVNHASHRPIAYTEGFRIGKEYIVESLMDVDMFKIKRHVSVGDITTTTIDKTGSQKRCVLVEKLHSLTNLGHHYSGDIIREKCTGPLGKYDRYHQKGVGEIAIVRYKRKNRRQEIYGYASVVNLEGLKEKK